MSCPDVYVIYCCYKESCALVKMYSLLLQNQMMPCKGQSKTFSSKLDIYFHKYLMLKVSDVLLPLNFYTPQLSALAHKIISFETMSFHFITAYRIILGVLVKHKPSVTTTVKALWHMAGVSVIQF